MKKNTEQPAAMAKRVTRTGPASDTRANPSTCLSSIMTTGMARVIDNGEVALLRPRHVARTRSSLGRATTEGATTPRISITATGIPTQPGPVLARLSALVPTTQGRIRNHTRMRAAPRIARQTCPETLLRAEETLLRAKDRRVRESTAARHLIRGGLGEERTVEPTVT